jgi:hypothetical protein
MDVGRTGANEQGKAQLSLHPSPHQSTGRARSSEAGTQRRLRPSLAAISGHSVEQHATPFDQPESDYRRSVWAVPRGSAHDASHGSTPGLELRVGTRDVRARCVCLQDSCASRPKPARGQGLSRGPIVAVRSARLNQAVLGSPSLRVKANGLFMRFSAVSATFRQRRSAIVRSARR